MPLEGFSCLPWILPPSELDKFDQTVFKSWRLHHDHITEKFLGYVCHICNTGMGNFKDDPQRMRKTADWLESVLK